MSLRSVGRSATTPYGSVVKKRYDELVRLLSEKYGPGTQFHYQDPGFYSEPSHFLWAIHSGHAWHYTTYETDALKIYLEIDAWDMSDAYWKMIFDNRTLQREFEKSRAQHEKEAL